MRLRWLRLGVAVLALGGGLAGMRAAASQAASSIYTVTSAADPGDGVCDQTCTLRDAILAANQAGIPGRIAFAVGQGPVTIRPLVQLPRLTAFGLVIDGASQPGYTGKPVVALDGSAAPQASGLISMTHDVEIRGLAVRNFARYGIAIMGEEADNNRLVANWVGVGPDGRTPAPNRLSGVALLDGADNARIGDACAGCGNRIGGNSVGDRTGHGILVAGAGTAGHSIAGNSIGLGAGGDALPNDDGILVVDGGNATIGGRTAAHRNVISGNRVAGVEVRSTGLLDLRIEGNSIGLSESGATAVGNDVGVFLNTDARHVYVGAAAASARNVISGNRVGVAVEDRARSVVIAGNWIGLDGSGAQAIGNTEDGVSVVAGASDVRIGGATEAERNLISGNGNGVIITDAATRGVTVQGNWIGLAADSGAVLGNTVGVMVRAAAMVEIGGDGGRGNVIVGSAGPGIVLAAAPQPQVRGNHIGLRPDGAAAGNGLGLSLEDGTQEARVEENWIGGNQGAGVRVVGDTTLRNRLSGNRFGENAGLAIDLLDDGPTPNDAGDTDRGPNGLLNRPVLITVAHAGLVQRASGSAPPRARIEVYRVSPEAAPLLPHPSGVGGAAELLSITSADAAGAWESRISVREPVTITALAIDAAGNTSEFALNATPAPPLALSAGFTPVGWFGPATPAQAALAPLGTRLIAAFRYDAAARDWAIYRPAQPFLTNLLTLDPGDALWVQLTPGGTVRWSQPAGPAGPRAVPLHPGVNFVTWTGPAAAVDDAIAPITGGAGRVERVIRWNPQTAQADFLLPRLPLPGIDRTLQTRDRLWIWVDRAVTWEQPGE